MFAAVGAMERKVGFSGWGLGSMLGRLEEEGKGILGEVGGRKGKGVLREVGGERKRDLEVGWRRNEKGCWERVKEKRVGVLGREKKDES